MNNKLLRYISDDNCALYSIRSGTLHLEQQASIKNIKSSGVNACILGGDNIIWSEIAADNLGFQPQPKTFIFANETILPLQAVNYLPPELNPEGRVWRQIWVDREKFNVIQEKLPSIEKFYPEISSVVPPKEGLSWKIGHNLFGSYLNGQIRLVEDQVEAELNNLEGFKFLKKSPAFRKYSKEKSYKTNYVVIILLGLIFPWIDTLLELFLPEYDKKLAINNQFDYVGPLSKLAKLIEVNMAKSFEINQENSIIKVEFDKIIRDQALIENLINACQPMICEVSIDDKVVKIVLGDQK